MKTSKSSSAAVNNLKIVEKKKIWFLIPAIIAVLTAIMLTIFAFTANSPVNVGVDIAGGYYITVKSTAITDDTFDDYVVKMEEIACNLSDANGKNYGLNSTEYRIIGETSDSQIYISYKRIKGASSEKMTEAGEAFKQGLEKLMTYSVPTVSLSGDEATITFDRTMSAFTADIELQIKEAFPAATLEWLNPVPTASADVDPNTVYATKLRFANAGGIGAGKDAIVAAATIVDEFAATVSDADTVSGKISMDLINYTIIAAILAITVAFVYFLIRFKSVSLAYTVALGLLLDIAMVFCLMMIFHIEINALIFAALAAIIVYSVYNKAIVFDRVKENIKKSSQEMPSAVLVNNSIGETLKRTVYVFVALFVMLAILAIACLIVGAVNVAIFTLPLAFGLISAVFSTIFISPSLWALINKKLSKPKAKAKPKKKEPTTI